MQSLNWQPDLPHSVQGAWREWICEPGSLTRRCQRVATNFQVNVLSYRRIPLLEPVRMQGWCREVSLMCDGAPVIFAQTTLLTAQGGRLSRWLRGLGNRSLGSLLFTHPGFRRAPIEYAKLRPIDGLYQQALRQIPAGEKEPQVLWARRSTHSFAGQALVVVEVFLPGLAAFF